MDIPLRLFTGTIIFTITLVRCVKSVLFFFRRARKVPPVENCLLQMSATELAEKIRTKQISCQTVISTYIDRIKLVNPIINAVAEDRFEAALRDAKAVDNFLSDGQYDVEKLKQEQPLLGIPVTIKENLSLKGLSATMATKPRIGVKAEENGEAVKILLEAGAIPLLVSTTPEYCLCLETYSKVFGITRNPYNTLRVSGGSSGGEGALIGAGASLIGLGSDLAGSIRFPSAFNGVFGHKPTHALIPTLGHMPPVNDANFERHLVLGPMVRYADDLPLVMKVLAKNPIALKLDEAVDLKCLKVFYMEDCTKNFGLLKVQRSIKRAIRNCANHLHEKCGAELSSTKFPELGYAQEICGAISATIKYSSALDVDDKHYSAFGQLLLNTFNLSQFCEYTMVQALVDSITKKTPKRKIKKYLDKLDELKEKMAKEFGDNGVFLYPVFGTTAFRHKEFMLGYTGLHYAFIVNILGFPCTTVPVGIDSNGLPVSIQVVANINQDRICFAVAKELQEAFGGWIST